MMLDYWHFQFQLLRNSGIMGRLTGNIIIWTFSSHNNILPV